MIVTSERLRYLVAVADAGSFSAAGRRLGVSAAAVQQSVQALEEDLQLTLFDRGPGRAPRLTDAGKTIYFEALELVPKLEHIEQLALAYSRGVETHLTISVHGLVFYPRFQDILVAFSEAYPQVALSFVDSERQGLRGPNNPRGADIMLAPAGLEPFSGHEHKLIDRIRWIFVAAAEHPLARMRGSLSQQDLIRYPQLLPRPGLVSSDELIGGMQFGTRVIDFECFYQFRQLLLRGMAFAFYPEEMAAPMLASGELVRLSVDFDANTMSWPIQLSWVAGQGEAGRWLLEKLLESRASDRPDP